MKDWANLIADEDRILTKHFTKGRNGKTITKIVLHHNAGTLTVQGCYNTWQTREASAHYQVQIDGWIGQLVHDYDTAWHAANRSVNETSIGIEHANDHANPWTISEETLDAGAHLVAAICHYYGLGAPQWGVNVFGHSSFTATACPGEIGGSQNARYMQRANDWYDAMATSTPATVCASVPLQIDGYAGSLTIQQLQRVVGTPVDGVISGQLRSQRQHFPNITMCTWEGTGSPCITAVQQYLGVEPDGLLGVNTISAWQTRLGVAADGIAGPATIRALQAALNNNTIWQ